MPQRHDDHLLYYQREMSFLRRMGGIFAAKYPKIAKRLNLSEHQSTDPHVERLLESFAYLTSYLQKDIDNQFPRISSALLSVLYPYQTTLIPPLAIAHFDAHTKSSSTEAYTIPKHTPIASESTTQETCRFRTGYNLDIWPIAVENVQAVSMGQYDFASSTLSHYTHAIKISLKSEVALNTLNLDTLRFYINRPQTEALRLYHLLLEEDAPVFIIEGDSSPKFLPQKSIIPVGFGEDEEIIPSPKNGHRAYGLLQEYFLFPQKFMFFDITHLKITEPTKTLEIVIPIFQGSALVSTILTKRTFLLGCTPIINLFSKISEPIRLNHQKIEYRLVPDQRRESTTEICGIDKVFSSGVDETDVKEIFSYFSYNHHAIQSHKNNFWHTRRVPSTNPHIPGTEMLISFVDLDMTPTHSAVDVAYAHVLCTNRHLASTLEAGTLLYGEDSAPPVRCITCLEQPTETVYPPEEGSTQWQLIAQLALNHLSFSSEKESLEALKEILILYAGPRSDAHTVEIESLKEMVCEPALRRMGSDAWRGFVKGTAVTISLDGDPSVASPLLFMSVLSHFFGLYVHINSFAELSVKTHDKEGIWKQWPPITGVQKLL